MVKEDKRLRKGVEELELSPEFKEELLAALPRSVLKVRGAPPVLEGKVSARARRKVGGAFWRGLEGLPELIWESINNGRGRRETLS